MKKTQEQFFNNDLPYSFIDLILYKVLKTPLREFNMISDEEWNKNYDRIDNIVKETLKKEKPLQYIVNTENFAGYYLYVDENVLIPRVETEELIYNAKEYIENRFEKGQKLKVLDLCCGSGCIAIGIHHLLNKNYDIDLYISDISEKAIEIAEYNLNKYDITHTSICTDFLEEHINAHINYDVILCNPPYIDPKELAEELTHNNEPSNALYAENEGMFFYQKFEENMSKVCNDNTIVCFEIGYDQGQKMKELFSNCIIKKDLSGKDRNAFLGV